MCAALSLLQTCPLSEERFSFPPSPSRTSMRCHCRLARACFFFFCLSFARQPYLTLLWEDVFPLTQVCQCPWIRPQLPHTAPTGRGTGFTGVRFLYPAPKIAHKPTQGRVSVSPSFSGTLFLWQRCQLLLQLVIYCLLDRTDSKLQGAITHLAGFRAHLGWLHLDE